MQCIQENHAPLYLSRSFPLLLAVLHTALLVYCLPELKLKLYTLLNHTVSSALRVDIHSGPGYQVSGTREPTGIQLFLEVYAPHNLYYVPLLVVMLPIHFSPIKMLHTMFIN